VCVCVCVIDIAAAEAVVSHLIVERNGSNFLVSWNVHATVANVINVELVWCASRSSLHGCQVCITRHTSYVVIRIVTPHHPLGLI